MAVLGEVDVGVVGGEDGVGGTDDGECCGGGHGEWMVSGGVGGVDQWWLYLWCVCVLERVCVLSFSRSNGKSGLSFTRREGVFDC